MKILGISAYYHDSAAAICVDGKVVAAAQEERFSRKKHDESFPIEAVRFCLQQADLKIGDLDAIAFYDKPLLKFERLLETYYAFAPTGLGQFIKSMPVWAGEKLFLKQRIRKAVKCIDPEAKDLKLLFPEHHLSHAASAFYPSPFENAAILTIDGVGEWSTASISHGEGSQIEVLKELHFPHSVGLLYSAFTYFLGFKVNNGEYKMMGLAPYGEHDGQRTKQFIESIKEKLVRINDDGSIWLDQKMFSYAHGSRMVHDKKWQALFGLPRRAEESKIEQAHCDMALAAQIVTEEIVVKMAREVKRLTGAEHLCMAGGVALNCVANAKIRDAGIFKEIFVQPAAGDAGGALGAALAAEHIYFQKPRKVAAHFDPYLGPEYKDFDVAALENKFDLKADQCADEAKMLQKVASALAAGKVVGWFQDRMEFGPRALGNRSILANARSVEMQRILNLKIKFREGFRPFAPAVLEEDAKQFFELKGTSPYMLFTAQVKDFKSDTEGLNKSMSERLAHERSSLPAITHVDGSARVQTVNKEQNPNFHALLAAFKEQTGVGVLVNTSFNVRGEPIVNTPEEACACFVKTGMDVLVVENTLFLKNDRMERR